MKKRETKVEIRRQAMWEVRAAIRADILLYPAEWSELTAPQILGRVTDISDRQIEKTETK